MNEIRLGVVAWLAFVRTGVLGAPSAATRATKAGSDEAPTNARAKKTNNASSGTAAQADRPAVLVGDGLLVDEGPEGVCIPVCGFAFLTDPDTRGDLDGFGYEGQRTCIADGTTIALASPRRDVLALPNMPPPGAGIYRESKCYPVCASQLTDEDPKTGVRDGGVTSDGAWAIGRIAFSR